MIDQACREIISPLAVAYDDFIETVYDIASYPLKMKGDLGANDRDFMTSAADMLHKLSYNCFAESLARSIFMDASHIDKLHWDHWENSQDDSTPQEVTKVFVVSDLRYPDELKVLKKLSSNVHVIKFDVSPETQKSRLLDRDGFLLTEEQNAHPTQSSPFDEDEFDLVINTDTLSPQDQAVMMKDYIMNTVKEKSNA